MEQPFSTSKVTVEYFDPHGVYKLLAPGLIPRLPLRNLHWQSHAGPLRSIDTLHVDLVPGGSGQSSVTSPAPSSEAQRRDDGFQTQALGGQPLASPETADAPAAVAATTRPAAKERRHQIPGLRQTPYLKVLLVRCDDNDSYKASARAEIREWVKEHAPPSPGTRKASTAENHDAFEWLIVHVVIPNTVAATQPRATGKGPDGLTPENTGKSSSRWRGGSSSLLEKLRSDFNSGSKSGPDRVAQVRIGINDVPYDILPRVVPAVPSGYSENGADAENAWAELIGKLRDFILSSFDMRVSQYEDDIREKDSQRSLPGWNFCTFFILKEGLARGFESVGLVEDALVGYDELGVGLDTIIKEQAAAGAPETHGGALLRYTEDLYKAAQAAISAVESEEAEDLQSKDKATQERFDEIPISPTRKPYRDLILANNVSIFDFRSYIFARQITLLLRLGNAWTSREQLLAKLKEQQDSVMPGVAPRAPQPKPTDETENLSMLAEVCRRTLEFIPAVSQVMRQDLLAGVADRREASPEGDADGSAQALALDEVLDNVIASFAFSVAQQILAQTSTKALPIPPSMLAPPDAHEQKAAIPEPKTMMHPARSSSLSMRPTSRPPPSPNVFTAPDRRASQPAADVVNAQFLKAGLEDLAARRAELYALSRNILEESGKKRGWDDGWSAIPIVGDTGVVEMQEIRLDDDEEDETAKPAQPAQPAQSRTPSGAAHHTIAGLENRLLRTALDNREDFYRLYETMTDKALRHYTVAEHNHSVQAHMADLAVLKYYLEDYASAASYFDRTTPFFGESGWSLLELSMLVMYSNCLRELARRDEYVRVVLKLLSTAATAESDRLRLRLRLRLRPSPRIAATPQPDFPAQSAMRGFIADLLENAREMSNETRVPISSLFCDVELAGLPVYQDRKDCYTLNLHVWSLLADDLPIDSARVHLSSTAGASPADIWMDSNSSVVFSPGKNSIELTSNVIIPGSYQIDRITFHCGKLCLFYERDVTQPGSKASTILRNPHITLYQRTGALDVRLSVAKHLQLDKNHSLDLEWTSGWNEIMSCELRVRAATGGLRLMTSEAEVLESDVAFSKPPDGGLFSFGAVSAGTSVKIRLPFTIEQELFSVAVRIEITYSTEHGTFTFCKTPSVNVALALGVNVQDVFKHKALFSRFTVSTGSASPLRLFSSELLGSDVFESHFGVPPGRPVVVFPKQPASLLYKITRKPGSKIGPGTQRTMYLKLYYSVLQDEIESLVDKSLASALDETPLSPYSRLVTSNVGTQLSAGLTPYDLERAALLGEISTSLLAGIRWEKLFAGLGSDVSSRLSSFIVDWQTKTPRMPLMTSEPAMSEARSILIPVDTPPVTIVHTADIRMQGPLPAIASDLAADGSTVAAVNQLLPATLHLKWTRIWDTGDAEPGAQPRPPAAEDLEFSYEVTAPPDTWLLGGRRKGHFVIPAPPAGSKFAGSVEAEGASSTAGTEADIPLLLIPLREGWLPYPTIDIHEVRAGAVEGGPRGASGAVPHCETDYRNLGETVRVVADRARVTVSLDTSGPGGGPLVLESERRVWDGRVVA